MIGRIGTLAVAGAMAMGLPGAALAGSVDEHQAVLSREDEDGYAVLAVDDDDDDAARVAGALNTHGDDSGDGGGDDSNDGDTSGVNSNDATGSGFSAVSRDRDRSQGDITRDRTQDGGDGTRDRSAHNTNDSSRNDTR